MEEFEIISYGIKAIKQSLFDFVKKIPAFVFFYSRMFVPVVIVGLATFYILKILGISIEVGSIIFKIILMVGQIIPAASYAGIITNNKNVEGSMDICFSGVIISSLLIWYAL